MKKNFLFGLLFLFPLISYGAIARDANSTVNTTADPVSWSHTSGALATVGVVGFSVNNTSDIVTTVTWAGATMTLLSKGADPSELGGGWTYLYYIASPSIGAQTISVDLSASTLVRACAETYSGTDLTFPVNVSSSATVTSANTITVYATSTVDNVYFFNWTQDHNGTPTPGTNETQIAVVANNICTDYDSGIAGAKLMTTNLSGVSRARALMVGFQTPIAEAGASTSTTPMQENFFGIAFYLLLAIIFSGTAYFIFLIIKK